MTDRFLLRMALAALCVSTAGCGSCGRSAEAEGESAPEEPKKPRYMSTLPDGGGKRVRLGLPHVRAHFDAGAPP